MKPQVILFLSLVLMAGWSSASQHSVESEEWRGFPLLPPITNANPGVRNPISVHVPTQLRIERTADMLSVTIDTNRLESTNLTVGANMVIGVRSLEFVYPVGEPRPANDREGLGGLAFGSATSFYHTKPDEIPQAGTNYVVEMELEVFETDIPPQHMWSPQSKNYKVLWRRTLKRTVVDFRLSFARPFVAPPQNNVPQEALFPANHDAEEHGAFADIAGRISALSVTWADLTHFKAEDKIYDFLANLLNSPTPTWTCHIWSFADAEPVLIAAVGHSNGKQGQLFVWRYPNVYWAYLDENGKWWWSSNENLKMPNP